MIHITCKGNSAICTRTERLTSGMVGLQCKFEFDSAWDGLARTAVFLAGNEKRDVLLTGDTCTVPWEVLKTAGYQLVIGVYGTNADGTLVIPTVYAMCGGIASGADPSGDESTDPTLPVWGQLQGMIGNLNDLQTTSKDNLVDAINEAAQSGGGGGASVEPAEDDIPKVFFGGALQQTKDEVVVPFRYISKTQDISGYAEIKAQGNSSMSYPKKNQTVKLYKDAGCTEKLKVDFKGWGKQNKYCYKANWIDLTHARNVVSARLWADVVKSRTNYAELPELLRTSPNQGAVDGFPIKVYAAGVYQGRYTLNIPKDKWAFNMDDNLEEHCILCGENYVSGCFRASANIDESDWTDEIHVTVPASIKTRWNEVISFVMNSTDEEFKANLGNYFDVESLLDYHLFGLVSCGLDAYGKNQIYMTYDGQKWIATMYDMDSTWGLYWNGSKFVETDYGRDEYEDMISGRQGNLLYIRLEELFYEELQARWEELRSGALSIENIINRFERFTDIAPAELVKEDYASTTGDGKFTDIPSKTTSTIQQIRAYAVARHAWCDTYVAGLTPSEDVPCTGITLSASTLTFTEAGSQTLTATVEPTDTTDSVVWSVSPTGIVTVAGGVVTAVANGSCTITATCGEQSATCAVSVSGIEAVALYPFVDATKTFSNGIELSVSGGNHVKITAPNGGTQLFAILNDVTANSDDAASNANVSNYVGGLTEPAYGTVVAGDTITRKIKNLVVSNVGASLKMAQNLIGGNKNEEKFGADIVLGTAESPIEGSCGPWTYIYPIWGFNIWLGSSIPVGAEIEFDIEFYVGDVRYI